MYQITNQTLTQTVDAIQDLDRRVSEIDDGLLWRAKDSEKLGGYTADHFAERVPDATKGNLAALDESGNLVDSGKRAGDFALLGQHGVVPYTHVKNGTVHSLAGAAGTVIRFRATADFEFGDSWSLGGKPVSVTYQGGEELLPTAVLAGDCVMGVVEGSAIRLALQMPVPQEAVPGFMNGDFRAGHVINQRAKDEYTTWGHVVDGWFVYGPAKLSLKDDYISLVRTDSTSNSQIRQVMISPDRYRGRNITATIRYRTNLKGAFLAIGGLAGGERQKPLTPSDNSWREASLSLSLPADLSELYLTVLDNSASLMLSPSENDYIDIIAVKLEYGNRFTGWVESDSCVELAKCQSRQIHIGLQDIRASFISPNDMTFLIPTPVSLNANPALTSGVVKVKSINGVVQEGFTFTFTTVDNGIRCGAFKTAHGMADAILFLDDALFDANL